MRKRAKCADCTRGIQTKSKKILTCHEQKWLLSAVVWTPVAQSAAPVSLKCLHPV